MNSELELLGLKETPEHLDKIAQDNSTPNIIAEVEAVGSFPTKRLCIGNILMVAVFELSNHDGHWFSFMLFLWWICKWLANMESWGSVKAKISCVNTLKI